MFAHELEHVAEGLVGAGGDRVDDHAALGAFDFLDLASLQRGGKVLVDDADTAFAGDGDGAAGFGHRVHRSAHDGQVEADAIGQPRANVHFGGQHVAVGGHEQNIVEGQGFTDGGIEHGRTSRRLIAQAKWGVGPWCSSARPARSGET